MKLTTDYNSPMRYPSLLVVAALVACGGSDRGITDPGDGPSTGDIQVSTSTSGEEMDGDGYQIVVADTIKEHVSSNGSVTISNLEPGSYQVEVREVQANCWLSQQSDTRTVRVTAGSTATVSFAVQCEKQRLVFSANNWEKRNQDIGLIRPDGSGLIRLTNHRETDRTPSLSHDLSRVVYERDGAIFVIEAKEGGSPRKVIESGDYNLSFVLFPVWDPTDGDKIYFVCGFRNQNLEPERKGICSSDLKGNNLEMVVELSEPLGCEPSLPCVGEISVSPSGDRFAFVSDENLYITTKGGELTGVASSADATIRHPEWGTDGSSIFFSRLTEDAPFFQIYRIDLGIEEMTLLTPDDGRSRNAPSVSPRGNKVSYANSTSALKVMDARSDEVNLLRGTISNEVEKLVRIDWK